MASTIGMLISNTPELKKKLAEYYAVRLGANKYALIDPNDPQIHAMSSGKFKGKVFMTFDPVEIVDANGDVIESKQRGPKPGNSSSATS